MISLKEFFTPEAIIAIVIAGIAIIVGLVSIDSKHDE